MKRVFDFFLALMGLFASLPLWFILGLAIWLEDKGPIFYLQDRVGKDGRLFKCIKFRSMVPCGKSGLGPMQTKNNDPRQTKIGRLMRKTAMDELPQLLNILKGDMSFVGPRPLQPAEVELNDASQVRSIFQISGSEKRSRIKSGLTGAAQVYASRNLAPEDKFKYDLWYVDNMGFWLDIKLITRSILLTLKARWDK